MPNTEGFLRQDLSMVKAKKRLAGYADWEGVNWRGEPTSARHFEEVKEEIGALGIGRDSIVMPRLNQPDKVDAVSFRVLSPTKAKLIYRTQRILSTLFPHNFPRIYAAFGANQTYNENEEFALENYSTGTIRQRIYGRSLAHPYDYSSANPIELVIQKIRRIKRRENDVKYPLSDAIKTLIDLGAFIEIDGHIGNIMIGEDGGEYYVDIIDGRFLTFDSERVSAYMNENGFSEEDKQVVAFSLKRVEELRLKVQEDECPIFNS